MTPLAGFVCGATGSLAIEIVSLASHYDDGGLALPARYSKVGFWVARLLLAGLGGALAVAYGVTQPILAVHIGVATPLIVRTLRGSVPVGLHAAQRPRRSRTGAVHRGSGANDSNSGKHTG
jgi:hypothetical protein